MAKIIDTRILIVTVPHDINIVTTVMAIKTIDLLMYTISVAKVWTLIEVDHLHKGKDLSEIEVTF